MVLNLYFTMTKGLIHKNFQINEHNLHVLTSIYN